MLEVDDRFAVADAALGDRRDEIHRGDEPDEPALLHDGETMETAFGHQGRETAQRRARIDLYDVPAHRVFDLQLRQPHADLGRDRRERSDRRFRLGRRQGAVEIRDQLGARARPPSNAPRPIG